MKPPKPSPKTTNKQTKNPLNLIFWGGTGLILAAVAMVYLPSLNNQFTNWDDPHYIEKNALIQDLNVLNLLVIFSEFFLGNYHPLTLVSLAIDFHFFQMDPFGFHLVNLIIHLADTALVILFFYLLSQNITVGFFCGLFFGIHPLHVESVAWISERKDVLYGFFFILSRIFYLKHDRLAGNKLYYFLSPPVAMLIGSHRLLRSIVRFMILNPIVRIVKLKLRSNKEVNEPYF